MIMYGVCITDANGYNLDGIRELMQKAEIYEDFDINLKAISACMGHHEVKITEDVYINIREPIYDCSKEIGSFIAEIMPVEKKHTGNSY